METILKIDGLTKRYGKITALNKLNLSIPAKSVFGLLGPNGSGKTTTLGMILDVIEKSEGSFSWNIDSGGNVRKRIGAILESPNFYPYLSAVNNLKLICKIKEIEYAVIDPILKQVGLFDRKEDAFKTYSLGMKQRLAIASALLADPEVLILDEPTNGLDPKGIVEIRQIIREVAKEGRTIILASHLLDEVQKVCTHFCVLNYGTLIYSGEVAELSKQKNHYSIHVANKEQLKSHLTNSDLLSNWSEEEEGFTFILKEDVKIERMMEALANKKIYISHLSQITFNLEKKFIEILDQQS
jgi:ABC-2 type transport system ATP-binding protein